MTLLAFLSTVEEYVKSPGRSGVWGRLSGGDRKLGYGGIGCIPLLWVSFFFPALIDGESQGKGEALWQKQCAECHGKNGEGVKGEYKFQLVGDWPVHKLSGYIDENMPEDDPGACVCEDADLVAQYIYDAFYSPEAQLRNTPPSTIPSHLTVRQLEESLSDIIMNVRGVPGPIQEERGLKGTYYNDRNYNSKKEAFERIDPQVDFDFGDGSPKEGEIKQDAFSIRWYGSILAEETGWYEIYLHSENGCRLWLNDEQGHNLIEGWVASGIMAEHSAKIRLLAGRIYPLRIDFFNFKGKSSSIKLLWKSPHGVKQVIPTRNLLPGRHRAVFVPNTVFPPDDTNAGFPRGTLVSRKWTEATTFAALECADYVVSQLHRFVKGKPGTPEYQEKAKELCSSIAGFAFRRPLTPKEIHRYVEAPFESLEAVPDSVKRSLLLTLSSPLFLYPNLQDSRDNHHSVASRLSLSLYDSLPDNGIRSLAERKLLDNPKILRAQARRMLANPRSQTKLQDFFYHWLEMHHTVQLAKDPDLFPGFDKGLIAELRISLQDFIDHVVWETPGADYRQLLQVDTFFTNPRLAEYYQTPVPVSEFPGHFEKVKLGEGPYSGILTHPYLLAQFAYARNSSPIHRGVFLTRKILGRHLQPPPEAVEFEESEFPEHLTLREKIEELTSPKNCQGCHSIINPLGFTMEGFDAVGRFRETLDGETIDTHAPYTTRAGESVTFTSAKDIAAHAIKSPMAQKAFVKSLFQYYTKQSIYTFGPDALDQLHQFFTDNEYNIRELIVEACVLYALMPDLENTQ